MKIAFVGGGNMATAILGGLLAQGSRGEDVLVVEPNAAARAKMAAEFQVNAVEAAGEELSQVDVIVLAVKPQVMREVATSIRPFVGKQLVVSIAAGIRLTDLSRWLGGYLKVIRAMPNTPALVHAGVTGLFAPEGVSEADRRAANDLLAAVGATVWFDREGDLDAVTAVSGSGPAYVFYAMEALETAARELDLPPDKARTLALWTFVGAAKLAIERSEDPAKLRANVTSKGGTTERALSVMEASYVREKFVEAVKAAAVRSRELGDEFGKG